MSQNIFTRHNLHILGQGSQVIMFLHGFGCDQSSWHNIIPAFEPDYRILLLDYVGSGKSDHQAYNRDRYTNLYGYAQDILDICFDLNLTNIIAVGHSISGIISLLASISQPERFKVLILIGSSPCYLNYPPEYLGGFDHTDIEELLDMMDKNYLSWANMLAPMVMKNNDRPELSQELENSLTSNDPFIAHEFAHTTFYCDHRADLAKVSVPSLIMQCTDDVIVPIEVGQYLHDHLADSKLVIMNATGHYPHLSHPHETIRIIQEYLS